MNRNYLKTLSIKFAAFWTHNYALFVGWAGFLIFIGGINRPDNNLYIHTFIISLILIFPFRFIKSAQLLIIHLYLLFLATFALTVYGLTTWHPRNIFDLIIGILGILAIILNFYFIRLYYLHRLNIKLINPFIERQKIIFLFKIFSIPLAIGAIAIVTWLYLYLDIHSIGPQGGVIATYPNIPQAEARFTKHALSIYSLYSRNEKNHSITFTISKKLTGKEEFIELYDKGQKIFRVDFSKEGIIKPKVFQKDGTSLQMIDVKYYSINPNLKINYCCSSNSYYPDQTIIIELNKLIVYPVKPSYIPLPFLRGTQDWQLTLKDSTGEIPLIKNIQLWY